MLFTDPVYLFLFFPIVVIGVGLLRRYLGVEAVLTFLFVASCIFYVGWGVDYLLMMLTSIVVNWVLSQILLALPDSRRGSRKWIFWLGIAFNISALVWFKYSFFIFNFSTGAAALSAGTVAIPVGISFYTFQQAVFLQDAYNRDTHVVGYLGNANGAAGISRGFVRYAAFIAFFPQLVIGPIVYLKEFAPQVRDATFGRIRRDNLEIGLFLLVVGLFKKVVIADNLARIVDPGFQSASAGADLNVIEAWTSAFGYYGQLYFDFSGYSDMALGAARILGITLPINFASPLKANSIADFYKRWHITLTRVIARFMYTPISIWGARFASTRISWRPLRRFPLIWLPLLVNFEVIALWHGAASTFLLFGIIHGLWYIAETETRQTSAWRRWKSRTSERTRNVLGRILFTVPMVLCFALFRSDGLSTMGTLMQSMFLLQENPLAGIGMQAILDAGLVFGAMAICWFLPNVYELTRNFKPGIFTWTYADGNTGLARLRWSPNLLWGVVTAGAAMATLYYIGRLPPFLYLGF